MIIMDTARAANFSCYGYERITSPHIDKIAEEGILFKNAISPSPWTLPSHVSMFTGLYPSEHGLTEDKISIGKNIYSVRTQRPFRYFLPEILHREGYRTVGFSNNPWVSHNFGFDKGFDFFSETWKLKRKRSLTKKIITKVRTVVPQKFHPVINNLKVRMSRFVQSDSGVGETITVMKEWFDKNRDDNTPFFVFFNFLEPHLPYLPPKPFDTRFITSSSDAKRLRKVNQNHLSYIAGELEMGSGDFDILKSLYDGEIAYLDSRLKEIFDYFKELNMMDDTFLVITSDHGENIGEHGLMGHQFCLYDTLLRVPLIMRCPEFSFRGKIEEKYVQLSDIFYTLLDVLDIPFEGQDVHKRSFLNRDYSELIFAEHEVPKISLTVLENRFSDFKKKSLGQELKCIYSNGMKYIWNSRKVDELYDLNSDPDEENNLFQEKGDLASRLLSELQDKVGSLIGSDREDALDSKELPQEDLDKEIADKLRDLGYI